ncbi:MAG: endonuclease, partial [Cruoricaptor ignavus]|nr:endonuclease [Cruoricaptor ignavus]
FMFSQAPAGYYDGTDGLSGYKLKSKLSEIVSKNYNRHYDDVRDLFFITDLDHHYDYGTENTTILLDMYTQDPDKPGTIAYTRADLISGATEEGKGWNREHLVPQSTFYGNYPMYSDLFSLVPADAFINQRRSNYPFAKVGNLPTNIFTNGSKRGRSATPGYNNLVYEPIDEFKGDIARALLYFAVRYEGKFNSFNYGVSTSMFNGTEEQAFKDWFIQLLKEWHQLDPVSEREIDRNNKVFGIQKNRNPFVDNPEFVEKIWQDIPQMVAPSIPTNIRISEVGAKFLKVEWAESTDENVLGYKVFNNGVQVGTTNNNYFYIDGLQPEANYQISVKAYNVAYLESGQSTEISATTLDKDNFSSDLFISKYIEGTGYNKAIEITNKTGHEVNLNNYRLRIETYITQYFMSTPFELEGVLPNNSSVVIMHPFADFSCYKTEDARFVTNSPAMGFGGSHYVEIARGGRTVDAVGTRGIQNSLANISLYREESISQPNTSFLQSEWQEHPANYCENLGSLASKEIRVLSDDITLYPNPVFGNQLFVKGNQISTIRNARIFDISGKMLVSYNEPFKQENSIDISHLKSGLYILVLDDKSYKFIKK